MTSPLCTVNGNATINGVNVSASPAIITIQLADLSGVVNWNCYCVGTDELNDPATITASMTIDPVLMTATLPSVAGGSALLFRSTVNSGKDVNGDRLDYSTTFGVYTLSALGRVGATNETTEGSAAYGWITKINPILRVGAAGVSGATSVLQGVVQLAGDLAGDSSSAGAPRVSAVTGIGGFATAPAVMTFGSPAAAAGALRITNSTSISARNSTNTGDLVMIATDSTNKLLIGNNITNIQLGNINNSTISMGTTVSTITLDSATLNLGSANGKVKINGGLQTKTRVVNSASVMDSTGAKDHVIYFDTSAGSFNLTLVADTSGREFIFKDVGFNADVNPVTIVRSGSETIEGLAANKVFSTKGGCLKLKSDPSGNWWVL